MKALKQSTSDIPLVEAEKWDPDRDKTGVVQPPGDTTVSVLDLRSATVREFAQFLDGREDPFTRFERGRAIETTLQSFLAIAHAYRGVPGRKALVWFTGAFPFSADALDFVPGPHLGPLYERALQALVEANVAVYPVDARGLLSADRLPVGSSPAAMAVRMTQSETIGTMQTIASLTGGRAFYNRNDVETGRCGFHALLLAFLSS
jgi:VWFA-related protein